MTLKVVDRFTTQHGSWDVNPANKYGIDEHHRQKYDLGSVIPGSGGDHHIFVKAPVDSGVHFGNDRGILDLFMVGESGWVNYPIYDGGWNVYVNGDKVADNVGFPGGEHVSTFLVVEDVDQGSQPPTIPGNQWVEVVLRTMVDGLQTKEEILWKSI